MAVLRSIHKGFGIPYFNTITYIPGLFHRGLGVTPCWAGWLKQGGSHLERLWASWLIWDPPEGAGPRQGEADFFLEDPST